MFIIRYVHVHVCTYVHTCMYMYIHCTCTCTSCFCWWVGKVEALMLREWLPLKQSMSWEERVREGRRGGEGRNRQTMPLTSMNKLRTTTP